MNRTKEGHNWYIQDLNCYTSEFLVEIVNSLLSEIEELKKNEELENCSFETPPVELENYMEKLLRIQEEQFLRLNRNIEQTNAILGEISISLDKE